VSDCLTPIEQCLSYIMDRTSYLLLMMSSKRLKGKVQKIQYIQLMI